MWFKKEIDELLTIFLIRVFQTINDQSDVLLNFWRIMNLVLYILNIILFHSSFLAPVLIAQEDINLH